MIYLVMLIGCHAELIDVDELTAELDLLTREPVSDESEGKGETEKAIILSKLRIPFWRERAVMAFCSTIN